METSGMKESKTNYLDGVFTYTAKYQELLKGFQLLYPGQTPVGLCVVPYKTIDSDMTHFQSTGIKVMLVRFDPAVNPSTDPDAMVLFDAEKAETLAALKVKLDEAAAAVPADAFPAPPVINLATFSSNAIVGVANLTPISVWNDYLYYNQTMEFEYTFIDLDTFEYLSNPARKEYYLKSGTSFLDKDNHAVVDSERGLHFSRAFLTMEMAPRNYKLFRTLKFRPHPEPAMVEFDSRPSIAYYIAQVCPPPWYQAKSVADTADNESAAVNSADTLSARQFVAPPKDDCTCNKMDFVRLHKLLKAEKYIGENTNRPYDAGFRPYLILLVISFFILTLNMWLRLFPVDVKEGTVAAIYKVGQPVLTMLGTLSLIYSAYVFYQVFKRLTFRYIV